MTGTVFQLALTARSPDPLALEAHGAPGQDDDLLRGHCRVVAAVIAVFVVATTVQVFRIGHSGAQATWGTP